MLMNMKDILAVAKENRFALPAFNISDYSMFLGIMDVCEETNSPVIIEIHPDELSFIGQEMVTAIKEKAYRSPVPVCIHLDHCGDFGKIIWAIQSGFTSVMFDGAELSFEDNIAGTKKVVEAAHPVNVSVEAELGTIGSTNPEDLEGGSAKIIYTNPEDAVALTIRIRRLESLLHLELIKLTFPLISRLLILRRCARFLRTRA